MQCEICNLEMDDFLDNDGNIIMDDEGVLVWCDGCGVAGYEEFEKE